MPDSTDAPITPETPAPEADAAEPSDLDAVLDGILDNASGDNAPAEPSEPSEPAEPEAKGQNKTAAKTGDKPADEPEKRQPYIDPSDIDEAAEALQLSGVPKAVIEHWKEHNPQKFLEWGRKTKANQAEVSRRLQDRAERGRDPESSRDKPEANAQPADALAELQPLIDELQLTPAAVKPFKSLMESVRQLTETNRQQQQRIAELTEHTERREINEARASLRERFPQLEDDEAFAAVEKKMRSLARTGDYRTVREVMLDAARIKLGDATKAQVARELTEKHKLRSAATPTTKTQLQQTPAKPAADPEDEILDAILDGKPLPSTARR